MEPLKQRLEALRDEWRAAAEPLGGGQRVGTGLSPSGKAVSRAHANALDAIIATMGDERLMYETPQHDLVDYAPPGWLPKVATYFAIEIKEPDA